MKTRTKGNRHDNYPMRDTEAAAYINFSVHTLRQWRWEGCGPVYKKIGGAIRYFRRDLDAWIDGMPTIDPINQQ